MKISELIEQLKYKQSELGDVEVYFYNNYYEVENINTVTEENSETDFRVPKKGEKSVILY